MTTIRSAGAVSPVWGPTEIAFGTVKPRGGKFTFEWPQSSPTAAASEGSPAFVRRGALRPLSDRLVGGRQAASRGSPGAGRLDQP